MGWKMSWQDEIEPDADEIELGISKQEIIDILQGNHDRGECLSWCPVCEEARRENQAMRAAMRGE